LTEQQKPKPKRHGIENLKPTNTLTVEERKKLARKGGIASGKARQQKADLKKTIKTILSMNVTDPKDIKKLQALGLDLTYENLVSLATIQQASKGNQRAMENVIKLTTTDKDKYDMAEQEERIKALKLKNAKESAGANNEENIIIYDDV
jgi:hypothetical protein